MKLVYTLFIVGISTTLLLTAATFTNQISLQIHQNPFVNNLVKYQFFALAVGILATIAVLILDPASKQFLSAGNLNVIAGKDKWLGINGRSSWMTNGLQLLFVVSVATGVFMFFAVKSTGSLDNFQWSFIPWIVLFSVTNSLTEELIFRFGIIGGLYNHFPKGMILILSAVLFGVPHYFGNPSGVIGVLMAGVLGYILCKAAIETKGLAVSWAIHFIQDVLIFTALMMMHVK
ncbi:CAAX amino terminal protease self- immunity [compost metagenome]